eukprot:7773052-Pyramimonas_sp.AAC.1
MLRESFRLESAGTRCYLGGGRVSGYQFPSRGDLVSRWAKENPNQPTNKRTNKQSNKRNKQTIKQTNKRNTRGLRRGNSRGH